MGPSLSHTGAGGRIWPTEVGNSNLRLYYILQRSPHGIQAKPHRAFMQPRRMYLSIGCGAKYSHEAETETVLAAPLYPDYHRTESVGAFLAGPNRTRNTIKLYIMVYASCWGERFEIRS